MLLGFQAVVCYLLHTLDACMIDCVHWEYERDMASMKYNIKHGGKLCGRGKAVVFKSS